MVFFPGPLATKSATISRPLVQQEFVQRLRHKLRVGGILTWRTDWENYCRTHGMEVMADSEGFATTRVKAGFSPKPEGRPVTKLKQRGERLGHGSDLLFNRHQLMSSQHNTPVTVRCAVV